MTPASVVEEVFLGSCRDRRHRALRSRSLLPPAVLAALCTGPLSAAAAELFLPGKDDRPPGRVEDYQRQSFPCDDPVQHLTLTPASLDTLRSRVPITSGRSFGR